MTEEPKAVLGIAGLLTIGLAPAVAALVIAPSREIAMAAAGNAAMAVAFVLWAQRLVSDARRLRAQAGALRGELSAMEEKVQAQARELRDVKSHDVTTGVLNRSAFLRRLDETISRDGRLGKPAAFLLVDVEGFKAINIERGRIGGDATLKRVAHALAEATRGTDSVGRLGGDEFGVVLTECEDPGPAVNRIFVELKTPAGGDGATGVQVAIGAVLIENPSAGVDLPELFRLAEAALASVRGTGGSLCARRTLGGTASRRSATAS